MRRRAWAALAVATIVAAACSGGGTTTDDAADPVESSTTTADEPGDGAAEPVTDDAGDPEQTDAVDEVDEVDDRPGGLVAEPVRNPIAARPIYFVMPDRFANGDPSNDTAGIDGGPLEHGFLPENRAYHHGGDLAGLTEQLDYIEALGVGSIWITSPFTNRWVQGDGTIEGSSSSYHGYWNTDYSQIDPHLGTEDEMQAFLAAARERDIAVIFDIVVNHTGDVIRFAEDTSSYIGSNTAPYLDADGDEFDPAAVAGSPDFPQLDRDVSFPYTPVFATDADATVKAPAWLNDPTVYHNRGDSTFSGESDTWGDFFGLDDLFTEDPRVVAGMTELFTDVIDRYDIDGFRVDTVKHVNREFWEAWVPAIRAAAAERGRPDFFVFGEVFDEDPVFRSDLTNIGFSSTLDFLGASALERYVTGGDGQFLAQALDEDDWFTDGDSNASMQVSFLGNHDKGRMGYLIDQAVPGADDDELLARLLLANDLLFLTSGVPVVYYGDEQGFTGSGGDQLARQSMFASVTPDYLDDDLIGTDATHADDRFDTTHPLFERIRSLNELRVAHPAFVTGAEHVHAVDGAAFAFSRIDRDERIEHLVVANSSTEPVDATVTALSPDTEFEVLLGPGDGTITSGPDGEVTVAVPPVSTIVLVATVPLAVPADAPTITLVRPDDGATIPTFRYRFEAALGDRRLAEVTFAVAVDGGTELVGVDDAPPYRVYWPNAGLPDGASVEVIATVDDGSGRLATDTSTVTLGER